MLGHQPAELLEQNWLQLVHPDDRRSSLQSLQELAATPSGRCHWDVRIRHKGGDYRWVEISAANLPLERKVPAIALYCRDIQDQRDTAKQHRSQTEANSRSNLRMEEFAYTVAHDLQEPLRAMSAFSQILLQRVRVGDEASQMAKFIFEGAARMSKLVRDLLAFARTGVNAPLQKVDLRFAAEEALKNLVLEIKESKATITVGKLPILDADESQLVMLFQNLVSNAIKYRSLDPVTVHVSAEQADQHWVVKVKDNGLGIAADSHARVFLPFIRLANRNIPETGLGLAVCKKIVDGLGGRIWVKSEPGLGSTFAFAIASDPNDSAVSLSQSAHH